MFHWEKKGKTVHGDGTSEILYGAPGCNYYIEARKKAIPHTQRGGVWFHTSYFLINRITGSEKEFMRLRDAQAAAEKG